MNVCDALALRLLLCSQGYVITFPKLFVNHIASEALARSIPLGAPVADSIRSLLLRKEHDVSLSDGAFACLTRRLLLVVTQVAFVLFAVAISWSALAPIISGVALQDSLSSNFIVAVPIVLSVCVVATLLVLRSGGRRAEEDGLRSTIHTVRAAVSRGLFSKRINVILALSLSFASWVMESCETFLVLNALGFEVSVQQALTVEAGVSVLRAAAFFLPSGIGVQEAGYAAAISAMHMVATNSGTFLIIKRSRDVFWILLGYALLLGKGITPFRVKFAANEA